MKKSFRRFFHQIKKISLSFLLCILALQALGLLSLYSASYGIQGENLYLFKQQVIWFFLGWLLFFTIYYSKMDFISKMIWPAFLLNVLALVLVFFIGREAYNSTRWLDLGLFHYQPSETLKFSLSLLIAKELSKENLKSSLNYKHLLRLCALIFPPIILVLIQPDLGTAGIILLILCVLLLFKGVEKKVLLILFAVFVFSSPLAWKFLLKPYQKARISSFIKPGQDPQGTGYNVIQSKIAIGSGQLFGKGFKKGTQNKLQFLPERHTDFIFSVLSEEYGFFGSCFTLLLFFFLIFFIFNLASQSRDRLNCYFCIGAGAFFLWHISLNLAMTMGLFPVVGIPLPLLSYGGSQTLTVMAFLGLTAGALKRKDLF